MNLLIPNKKPVPSLVIPKPVVLLSKTIEFFFPFFAARLAAKLFVTPINFKTPEREKYMLKSAQKKRLTIPTINKEIGLLSYGYSKKKVLLIHGWAGRSTQLFAFADKLLEKGYMVISFDGPAHGNSTGKTTSLVDFLSVIRKIEEEYGPFESAIGHSFGGMSLFNATSRFLKLKSFVTIGSSDNVSDTIKQFSKNLKLRKSSALKIQKILEKKWNAKAIDYTSNHVGKKVRIPVLIVHDTEDGDVPVSYGINIRQNLKNSSLLITHGLGHTKILRNSEVVNKSINFIIKNS